MQYGLHLPLLEPQIMVDLAIEGESAGWDGVFIWDAIWGIDVWGVLAAIAVQTQRLRIAPYLTPPSRRRPWKLASEAATLDTLSHGRAILPVGLGAPETGFDKVGEATDRKVRAQMLDESLAIIAGLWAGGSFSYQGEHYQVHDLQFDFPLVQQPRIPIWVVGAWPRLASMRRAIRWDGIMPTKMLRGEPGVSMQPADIAEMQVYLQRERQDASNYDIVIEGETPGDDPEKARAIAQSYADVGTTWWLENVWDTPWKQSEVAGMRQRIQQGPPRR